MNKERIIEIFHNAGICLDQAKAGQFLSYASLIKEHNQKYNLTAIIDDQEIIKKHFVDSVIGGEYLPKTGKIIDIGSGAGFPSVPLKIMQPQLDFTLIDSVNKKVNFLNIVIKELNFEGITAKHTRIEEEGRTNREKYDCVLARAVSPLPTLLEYALPLLKVGGIFVAYKGDKAQEEIDLSKNALKELGGKIKKVEKIKLLDEYGRSLIIVEKIAKTSEKYPRASNKPRTLPL